MAKILQFPTPEKIETNPAREREPVCVRCLNPGKISNATGYCEHCRETIEEYNAERRANWLRNISVRFSK